MYRHLANAAFYVHGLFTVAIIPSLVLLWTTYYPWTLLWLCHHVSVALMVVGQAALNKCPLVAAEEYFRKKADEKMAYTGSYVIYIAKRLTGLNVPTTFVTATSSTIAILTAVAIFR